MLSVALDVFGSRAAVTPKPESQMSPAAVPSIALCAEDQPSPWNAKVPSPSELIDTE